MTWRVLIPFALAPLLTSAAVAATDSPGGQISQVLATQGDWRAIAGLLAFMWVVTVAALLKMAGTARSDARAKDAAWVASMEASSEAKVTLATTLATQAAALNGVQMTSSRVESVLAKIERDLNGHDGP